MILMRGTEQRPSAGAISYTDHVLSPIKFLSGFFYCYGKIL